MTSILMKWSCSGDFDVSDADVIILFHVSLKCNLCININKYFKKQ